MLIFIAWSVLMIGFRLSRSVSEAGYERRWTPNAERAFSIVFSIVVVVVAVVVVVPERPSEYLVSG